MGKILTFTGNPVVSEEEKKQEVEFVVCVSISQNNCEELNLGEVYKLKTLEALPDGSTLACVKDEFGTLKYATSDRFTPISRELIGKVILDKFDGVVMQKIVETVKKEVEVDKKADVVEISKLMEITNGSFKELLIKKAYLNMITLNEVEVDKETETRFFTETAELMGLLLKL